LKARYEFKYLITPWQQDEIRPIVSAMMDHDPYAPDGVYSVYSLYFDDPTWKCARATLEGLRERFKLRIRTYGFTPDFPVFVEDKGRIGTSIVKRRALIDRETVRGICRGEIEPPGGYGTRNDRDARTVHRFRNLVDGLRMVPRLWVGYEREPYVSPYGDGSRLTFDRELHVQAPSGPDIYEPLDDAWVPVPLDQPIILEMKFNGAFPRWMQSIVHALQLRRTSCSKYTLGAVQVWESPWSRPQWSTAWTQY